MATGVYQAQLQSNVCDCNIQILFLVFHLLEWQIQWKPIYLSGVIEAHELFAVPLHSYLILPNKILFYIFLQEFKQESQDEIRITRQMHVPISPYLSTHILYIYIRWHT